MSRSRGTNTAAAVRKAEKVACPTCKVVAGHPCMSDAFAAAILHRPGKLLRYRSTKPHASRLRAAGVIPALGATTQKGTQTMKSKGKPKTTKTKRTTTRKNAGGTKPIAKLKRGRPANTSHPKRYALRHNDEQMAEWMAAAGVAEQGPVFQHWMRSTLDAAVRSAEKGSKRAHR